MKKLMILLMTAALGAASYSCNDQDFSDVEKSVMEIDTNAYIDDDEEGKIRPGGN